MINFDSPFYEFNPNTGELIIEIREGDKVSGAPVARVNLGNIQDVIADLQHTAKPGV